MEWCLPGGSPICSAPGLFTRVTFARGFHHGFGHRYDMCGTDRERVGVELLLDLQREKTTAESDRDAWTKSMRKALNIGHFCQIELRVLIDRWSTMVVET